MVCHSKKDAKGQGVSLTRLSCWESIKKYGTLYWRRQLPRIPPWVGFRRLAIRYFLNLSVNLRLEVNHNSMSVNRQPRLRPSYTVRVSFGSNTPYSSTLCLLSMSNLSLLKVRNTFIYSFMFFFVSFIFFSFRILFLFLSFHVLFFGSDLTEVRISEGKVQDTVVKMKSKL